VDAKHVQFDGSIPENYDRGLGPHIFEDYGRELADRVARCRPADVLELAAGTGIVSRMLRDSLDARCKLIATDLNEPMLGVARAKFSDGEDVSFKVADAQALPFDDGMFDAVACQFGIMFFPDKLASMREARRVLRPKGRYIFNVWGSFEDNPFARVANDVVCEFFPDDPPGFYQVPFSYHDEEEISGLLREAGFDAVEVETQRIEKTVEDFELFAQGIVFGNPIAEEIRSRGGVTPESVKETVLKAFRREFGAEPATMPLRAISITAIS